MRCPFCGQTDTQVKDSRPSEDGSAIRRRRICPSCDGRFTTFERTQLREITVVKRDGRRELFDRNKLTRALITATRKRQISEESIEQRVNDIVSRLEKLGESEIASTKIGEMLLVSLAQLDQVAYIRFASVYWDFLEAEDFKKFLSQLDAHKP